MERHRTFVILSVVVSIMVILPASDARSAIPTKCPKINSKNETIHLAHESDCTKFYKCDWGKRVLFDCPFRDNNGNRLHFNPELQVCDWPDKAGCMNGDSSGETTEDDLTSPMESSTGSSSTQTTVGTSSTSEEASTTPTVTSTTIGTTWPESTESPSTQTTADITSSSEEPSTSPTDTSSTTESTVWTTSVSTETTSVVTDDDNQTGTPTPSGIYVPHESNCSLFYEIINGTKYPRQCPNGLHFSPTALTCTWPWEAGCESTTPIPTTTTTEFNSVCGDCGDIGHGSLVPHECRCEKYYRCYNGDMILHECPNGLHFNAELHTCDYPESAGCSSTTVKTTANEYTTLVSIPAECPNDDSGRSILFPHPTNCSLYYRCINGMKQLLQCPFYITETSSSGFYLHFNVAAQMCDLPDLAGCIATTEPPRTTRVTFSIPNTSTERTTEFLTTAIPPRETTNPDRQTTKNSIPSQCPATATHLLISHEYDCSLYYECNYGNKELRECTAGLHFSPALKLCVWPEYAECQ